MSAPGRADLTSANLTPASGRQDHTILPSATTSLVRVLAMAHRLLRTRPAITPHAKRCRVHRIPHPTSVTTMIRPSGGRDGEGDRCDLGCAEREIFLQRGLDSRIAGEPVGQITGPAGSNILRHLAHRTRNFETTPSPPMLQACPNISRLVFHPDYAAVGSLTTLASRLCDEAKANGDRGQPARLWCG